MENRNFEEDLPKLLKIALFADFKADNENDCRVLKMLYEGTLVRHYKKDDMIIKEGDIGDEFYILLDGAVHISRMTPAGDSIALADLNASMNIFFGETALISNDTRSATVNALSDCKILVLSSKKFHEICAKEPVVGYRVLTVLARRMAQTIRDTNRDKATLYEALFNEISDSDY
ncbi:MAG: cyclic nucleotide-binding domain-containing protein [Treponema sp.]|nr:cyclic nucleotide-binding domain-containing protein [Treponema sp.]